MAVTYIPMAVKHGAEIRQNCFTFNINVDPSGKVKSVNYFEDGQVKEQEAGIIIVSGYSIETPRILLNSTSPQFPNGLANSSGVVGKYLMVHLGNNIYGRFDRPIDNFIAPPVGIMSEDTYGTKKENDFIRGYSLEAYSSFPGEFSSGLVMSDPSYWGKKIIDILDDYPAYTILGIVGEILPYEYNTVTIAGEKDEHGVPVAKVTFSLDDNSKKMSDHANNLCSDILKAAGANKTIPLYGTIHLLGTCRMGDDPGSSVVNRWCQSHDISNLFICDGSVFVTGGGVNPSLTIQAIASRTADYIINQSKSGELNR